MIAWCLENYNGNLYLGTVGDGVYELNSAGTAWSQVGSSLNKAVIQSLISYNGNLYAYTQNGVWVYSPSVSPTITGISPTTGPLEGGTLVTLSGSGFTGATSVIFGSTTATSFTVNSDTQITAMSPADSAGIVYVTVTGPGGTSSASIADQFTYVYPIPG
jgi:hypothetical protein